MNKNNAIEVRNMSKSFKVNSDKANTLKEKLLFWNRGETEVHQVLKKYKYQYKKRRNRCINWN